MKNSKNRTASILMSLLILITTMLAYPAGASAAETEAATELSGSLVFQTTYGGTFYTIDADGTNLQPITSGIDPAWSPDGDQIAFVRWEEPRGVWVVDVETGSEWRVFDDNQTRSPSWSPSGEEIVFTRINGGRTEAKEKCGRGGCRILEPDPHWMLGIVSTSDGGFSEPLPNGEVSLTPDWSPSGDLVILDGLHGLQVQSADGQTSYQLSTEAKDTSPVWSPDGTQVAFVRRQHDHWEIYLVNADGSAVTRLTDTPALADGAPSLDGVAANCVSPAWSPDGNHIAFLTDQGGEWEIWVMDSDGGNAVPLFDDELDALTMDYAFASERAIDWTE
jgi:Tol biopolymer transport system component